MAAANSSRRWATGALDVGSTSSASDSDSDTEDGDAPARVQLFSLPTAGGLRARRDSGPVQLPAAGGDSDSEDDDFGESVVPLVMPTRCPSRRDSRRCGFGHEISTAVVRKQEDMEAMRSEAETERLQRRRAEQMAQEEAERKAKVQEEGICVSEIVSLFSTTRPVAADASNPTLSPAAAPVACDDQVQTEEEPSPPWSDGDVADRAADDDVEEEVTSDAEDKLFGQRGSGRRKSVVQFPGWSSKAAGVNSSSELADSAPEACAAAPGGAATATADDMSVHELKGEGAAVEVAGRQQQRPRGAKARAEVPSGAELLVTDDMSVQDLDDEVKAAASEVQDAQQQRLAEMATVQPRTADETPSTSAAEAARTSDHGEATAAREAFASGVDWAENAWDEETEMEFVDEIRARQIEQLVRSGRMPAPAPPHSGFQSARALSRERDGRPNGGRPTSRGRHSAVAPAASASAAGGNAPPIDSSMMPRPPPKRAGSPKGRRPAPPPKAAGGPSGRVMSGRTVRGRTVAATATAAAPAAPVCV